MQLLIAHAISFDYFGSFRWIDQIHFASFPFLPVRLMIARIFLLCSIVCNISRISTLQWNHNFYHYVNTVNLKLNWFSPPTEITDYKWPLCLGIRRPWNKLWIKLGKLTTCQIDTNCWVYIENHNVISFAIEFVLLATDHSIMVKSSIPTRFTVNANLLLNIN